MVCVYNTYNEELSCVYEAGRLAIIYVDVFETRAHKSSLGVLFLLIHNPD